jgi:hypothetical protein
MDSVAVRRLTSHDWQVWRDIRLAALADAPRIFHGSLEEERAYGEAHWRGSADDGVKAVAFREGTPIGVRDPVIH